MILTIYCRTGGQPVGTRECIRCRQVLTLLEQDLPGIQIARLVGCTSQVVS